MASSSRPNVRKSLFVIASVVTVCVLFLASSSNSAAVLGTSPSSNLVVNCQSHVCAYVGSCQDCESIYVIYGTRVVKTIDLKVLVNQDNQEAWDYSSGLVIVPSESYIILINATTNTVFKIIKSKYLSCAEGALYNPIRNEVLLSNTCGSTLSVINATTWKLEPMNIKVGNTPLFLAYNSANREIYVSNFNSDSSGGLCGNNVTAISASTDQVIKTITIALSCPEGIAFNPANNETYVASGSSDAVSAITLLNLKNEIIQTIHIRNKFGFTPGLLNSGNGKVFAYGGTEGSVYLISSTNKVSKVSGFFGLTGEGAYDPFNGYEYMEVATGTGNYIQMLSGTRILPINISLALGAQAITTTAG